MTCLKFAFYALFQILISQSLIPLTVATLFHLNSAPTQWVWLPGGNFRGAERGVARVGGLSDVYTQEKLHFICVITDDDDEAF